MLNLRSQQFLEESTQRIDTLSFLLSDAFNKAAKFSEQANLSHQSIIASQKAIGYTKDCTIFKKTQPELATSSDIILSKIKQYETSKILDSDVNSKLHVAFCYIAICDYVSAYKIIDAISLNLILQNSYHALIIGSLYQYFEFHDKSLAYFTSCDPQTMETEYIFELFFRFSISYRALRCANECIQCIQKLYEFIPNYLKKFDIDLILASAYQDFGDYTQANSIYAQLYTMFPENTNVLQSYLWCLYLDAKSTRNFDKVAELAKYVSEKFPTVVPLNLICGRIFLTMNNNPSAYNCFTRCIKDMCSSPYFWCMLGTIYFKNEQFDDSIIAYRRSLFLNITCAEAWYNLVLNSIKKGEKESTENLIGNARGSCPDIVPTLEALVQNSQAMLMDIDESKLLSLPSDYLVRSILDPLPQILPSDLGLPDSTVLHLQVRDVQSLF
ncbi:hypothetical protein TVAG_219150 [Trichomonas vaginalis G3]|uniref:Uncharacterized protein n=1 Tax=Trichomonas vaginalis (strain ATCC PRA-98 / G3) TaxID=412133 RepID=A2FKP7_TRIV3|nr:cellular component assembly [Trichomonas vaginalis G3]EAX94509.1 hypothetical protein TVAG_219150 [Trichomonas vaginalis G3]KAI5501091.1 cellular component assembly [Trichomonas vaginalis G3]|eukprot:XP_001307439.1 hypothetical protein [Trichomonas vaginalis G3]